MFEKLLEVLQLLEEYVPSASDDDVPQFIRRLPGYTDEHDNDPRNLIRFSVAPYTSSRVVKIVNSLETSDFLPLTKAIDTVERIIRQTFNSKQYSSDIISELLYDDKFLIMYDQFNDPPCICLCVDDSIECRCACHKGNSSR